MEWKTIFKFNWIKLVITIIILFLSYEFRTLGMKIGGSQPIESYIMPSILLLSLIYLVIIVISGIVSKIKSKK
jgi:hypothetical protein